MDSSLVSHDSSASNGATPIYLNVYDVSSRNRYLYWFGIGFFHSGVEVHDVEYAFGAHEYPTTGVFEVEPRNCPGYMFRRTITIGTTDKDPMQLRDFIYQLASQYSGDSYHLLEKNCNHFTNDVCMKLTKRSAPGWVNRLANIGACCSCLLPDSLELTSFTQSMESHIYDEDSDENLLSGRYDDQSQRLLAAPSDEDLETGDHDDQSQRLLAAPNGDKRARTEELYQEQYRNGH